MLSRHAHSTHTASDARGTRARRCADRMEMGRRARSDALLRSSHAGGDQNGALGRPYGHRSTFSRTALAYVVVSHDADVRPSVQHDCNHKSSAGRNDREHGRRRASERCARTCASVRPQPSALSGRDAGRRCSECHVVYAHRGAARRAHPCCSDHRSARRAAAKQRAGNVLRSTDIDRKSARGPCPTQSASTASGPNEQQTAFHAAVLCRLERCAHRDRRPADESPSSEAALVDRALRSYRASVRARCIQPSLTAERLRW